MSEAVVEAASGVVGSIIALLATYPLKTIYTLQALNSNATQAPGILDIVLRYKLGLYVGIEPNIVESGLSSGVYFYLYSKLRSHAVSKRKAASAPSAAGVAPVSSKDQDIGFLASLLVPAIAAVGNQLLTMPASVVATRMQALKKSHMDGHSPNSPTVSSVIKGVWAESGIGGFWAGLLPSLVLISNPSIQFMLYEQLLRALRTWKRRCLMTKLAKEQQSAQVEAKVAMNWHAVSPNSTGSVGNIQPVDTTTLDNTDGASKGVQGEVVALDDNGSSASSGSSGWHTTEQTTLLGYEYNGPGSISPGHHPKVGGGTQAARPQSVQRAERAGSGDKAAQQIPPIRLAAWETFLASALSKIGATLATYWLVVVKSRMQAASKSRPDEQYKGTLDALIRIWREEGMGGFSKGLGAKLIQTALNAALMLMLKEQVYIKTRQLLTSPGLADRMRQHLLG